MDVIPHLTHIFLLIQQTDVIVVSCRPSLELIKARTTKLLLDSAGESIQDECKEQYPSGITFGDVAVTGPGKLDCQHIFLVTIQKYGNPADIKVSILYFVIFKPCYTWFVTWRHAISHLGRWLLHGSMRVIKLQPRFKVCNFSYLHVLFHNSSLLLTFWYINHTTIKGKEWIHLTSIINVEKLFI